jgi:nucleoside-diphosphate-sugar epimerase
MTGRRLAIIGGNSRAAIVLRKCLADMKQDDVKVFVRQPVEAFANESIHVTRDYFSLSESDFRDVSVAVNFIGITRGANEKKMFDVNALGPVRLAEVSKQCRLRQFVHVSSLSVYGDTEDITCNTPCAPVSIYGKSKLQGDKAILVLMDSEFTVSVLRVPILYGVETGGKLHSLTRFALVSGLMFVPRQLQPRSTLNLENLALAIIEVIRCGTGGVLFAADDEAFDLEKLAAVVSRHRARPVRLQTVPVALLRLLKLIAPGLYKSLFGRSLILAKECIPLPTNKVRPLEKALEDCLPKKVLI